MVLVGEFRRWENRFIQRPGDRKWTSVLRYLRVVKYFCILEIREQVMKSTQNSFTSVMRT